MAHSSVPFLGCLQIKERARATKATPRFLSFSLSVDASGPESKEMAKDGAQLSEDSSIKKSIELSEGGGGGENEEFYEEIEAPKFVDFTVPDHYRPDDRYWFCLRVGCDQKHEEEIDHEAISRNFVLRVMAARSPNVRLHKALYRNTSGKNIKCPLSAPPKSAKSRLPRLAIVSMSQKLEKVKLLPKVNSTPKTKGKQVAAKYLTTPRNKKIPPNANSFRSVQNPKPTVAVPKNGPVARALVFHSPKKTIRVKTSVELRTPLTKLCQGIKKLEITSQRKNTLSYSTKPSKPLRHDPQKSLPLNSSTRQKVTNKEKCRTKIPLHSHGQKDRDTKSLRSGKCKTKGNLSKHCSLKEIVQHDCTAETIMKSRDDTEEHLDASKISGHHTSTDSAKEAACPGSDVDSTSTKVSEGEINNSQEPSQISTGGNGIPRFQALDKEGDIIEGNAPKNTKESSENEENLNDQVTEFEPSNGTACESQMTQNDDKENASAFDENRSINPSNNQSGKEILGMKNADKKVAQAAEKLSKGSATIGAPGVKLMKPKPTHPRPFRLRTNERGILREANLERKNHAIAPQKEVAAITNFHIGDMQGHHDDIQKGNSGTAAVKTPKGQERNKKPTTPKVLGPLTTILEGNTCQDLRNDSRNIKSPSRRVLQPHRMKQMASQITQGEELTLTAETPSKILKDGEAKTPSKNITKSAVRSSALSGSKSSSKGRRPVTIPKEPNFHTSHLPKSCVRKIA